MPIPPQENMSMSADWNPVCYLPFAASRFVANL
jgi:hypothetical protein